MTAQHQPADVDFGSYAWASFIDFAAEQPDMVAAFTEATGIQYPAPAAAPATQSEEATRRFVYWVTEEHWGLEHAPPALVAEIRAEKAKA